MAFGDSAGILFKIKGDESDAIRALKNTEEATTSLTGTTASLTSAFNPMTVAAAAGAVAVTAIATASIAGTRALYDMAKSASDFGSEIFDASEKTGLSAERLSAMKFAADQSGASLDQVTAATARFSKGVTDAANGSKEAQARMDRLGVTSTDLDTALKQALQTIVKTESGTKQMGLAMEAFGKSGADLLPFIKSFDGDLDGLTQKAKALGVTITDEAAAAADQFGDQLDTLNAQFDGITRTVGNAFMPIFNDMARNLSDFLSRNQGEIQRWGQNASDIVRGFIVTLRELNNTTQDVTHNSLIAWANWANQMAIVLNPVAFALVKILQSMRQIGAEERGVTAFLGSQLGSRFDTPSVPVRTGGGGAGRAARSSTSSVDSEARKAEQLESRDVTAQIRTESINLRSVIEGMGNAYDAIRDKLKESGGILGFTEATNEATKLWGDNLNRSLTFIEQLEVRQLKADALQSERDALLAQQQDRRHKLKMEQDAEVKKNQDALFKAQNEQWDKQQKADADKAIADQERFDAEQAQMEARAAQAVTVIGSILPGLSDPNADEQVGPFDGWTASWDEFFTRVSEDGPTLTAVFEDLGHIMQDAFLGLAQAIGSVVQQWVLYGNTGPAVMRKILASTLAAVAAEAAVKAIMATAEGFYFLATGNYAAAANAFTAAAFYGAVAGVAALAGRAVAGNSFKQQTGAATGRSGSSSSSGGGNQGEAYSSYGDQAKVIEQGRNAPAVTVTISDDSQFLGKMLKFHIQNNNEVRDMIRTVAAT